MKDQDNNRKLSWATLFKGLGGLFALISVIPSAFAIATIFSEPIPVIRLQLSCNFPLLENGRLDVKTHEAQARVVRQNIQDFVETVHEHQGEVAFVSLIMEATSHARHCSIYEKHRAITVPDFSESDLEKIEYWVRDVASDAERAAGTVYRQLGAFTMEENGGTTNISFPDEASIRLDGLYTSEMDWAYYAVSGPFKLSYSQGNGYAGATITPLDRSEVFKEELSCIRRRLSYPDWIRFFVPCF